MPDDDVEPISTPLSPAGRTRRAAILALAQSAAQTRRMRRIALHVCLATLGAGAFATALTLTRQTSTPTDQVAHREHARPTAPDDARPMPRPAPPIAPSAPRPQLAAHPHEIVIQRIATDPTLVDRLSVRRQEPTWRRLDDDALLAALAAAGRPAGVAYVDGRAVLLFRDGSLTAK